VPGQLVPGRQVPGQLVAAQLVPEQLVPEQLVPEQLVLALDPQPWLEPGQPVALSESRLEHLQIRW